MTPCANPATGGAPDISFLATPDQARRAVMHVVASLADTEMAPSQPGDVELALAEVVNNIVEHGYAGRPSGAIRITCEPCGDYLLVSVRDQGRCIPGGLPTGCPPDVEVPVKDLPEGGFGWMLIRTLANSLSYSREGDQNRLDMQFSLRDRPN